MGILRGGGTDGILYIRSELQRQPERAVSHRERRQGGAELELARQQLEREQPGAPFRNSFHFFPRPGLGKFCFCKLFLDLPMPAAELLACLEKRLRQSGIFFSIQGLDFPKHV